MQLTNGQTLRHIDATTFIATKIESFLNRSGDDFAHHDIEDIITVFNGREELPNEITNANQEMKEYIKDKLGAFLEIAAFTDLIPGHLRPNETRTEIAISRLTKITGF